MLHTCVKLCHRSLPHISCSCGEIGRRLRNQGSVVCVIFPYEWGSESEYDFDKDYLSSEVWDPFPYKSYVFLGINAEKLASMSVTVTQIRNKHQR